MYFVNMKNTNGVCLIQFDSYPLYEVGKVVADICQATFSKIECFVSVSECVWVDDFMFVMRDFNSSIHCDYTDTNSNKILTHAHRLLTIFKFYLRTFQFSVIYLMSKSTGTWFPIPLMYRRSAHKLAVALDVLHYNRFTFHFSSFECFVYNQTK